MIRGAVVLHEYLCHDANHLLKLCMAGKKMSRSELALTRVPVNILTAALLHTNIMQGNLAEH